MLGAGIPGVSGLENASGPPTSARCANEPGVVPAAVLDGFVADEAAAEVAVAPLRAADVTDLASLVALGESLADARA